MSAKGEVAMACGRRTDPKILGFVGFDLMQV